MHALKRRIDRIKKLLLRRGSSREEAEEAVQEAVLRLCVYTRAGGTVRDEEGFMIRTAINSSIDARRRARSNLYSAQAIEDLELTDTAATPDEVFAAEQRLLKMKETLDQLSVRTRQIFFMHRLQGFSHAEIAAKLRISKSAVEKHIANAITTLTLEEQRE